ncbi:sensor histidine kinase [Micromonospora sp. AP08]|uniref:sensor histidine kinase n=1 Tax=Micromonospora sp. AP08 TaxID=2604467 RepID=UPI001651B6BD|nr:histidine kinase [Micromonospora sp. AP08]
MTTAAAVPAAHTRRPLPAFRDALLALAVWMLDLALFSTAGTDLTRHAGPDSSTVFLIGYAALGPLALLWRRRAPSRVFAAVWLHSMIGAVLVDGYQPVLGILVGLYTAGAYAELARAWLIAPGLAPFLVIAANEALLEGQSDPGRRQSVFFGLVIVYSLFVGGVWALGRWAGRSRRRLAASERRRVTAAEEAVTEERARISRELHDIVAHSVTLMIMQAAVARLAMRDEPDRAASALIDVEQQGRQAVEELRRMLSVIATDTKASHTETVASGPPGLDNLDELLLSMRRAGLAVDLVMEGTPGPVDPSVGLAAYRAVQEALTNTARHAGPGASAVVRLRWDEQLLVEITDAAASGVRPEAAVNLSTGHGLIGLQERVAVVGGELSAGPLPEGGFRIAARLPLPAAAQPV